jgi:hypothetical protein
MRLLKLLTLICILAVNGLAARAANPEFTVPVFMSPIEKERSDILYGRVMTGSVLHQAQVIYVDTRDSSTCLAIQKSLLDLSYEKDEGSMDLRNLCRPHARRPIVRIIVYGEISSDEYNEQLDRTALTTQQKIFVARTNQSTDKTATLLVVPTILIARSDPTAWDKVYLAHPLGNKAQYSMQYLSEEQDPKESGYSSLISTLLWQASKDTVTRTTGNIEEFATPIITSLVGEAMRVASRNIRENNYTLMGSPSLGQAAYIVLNPMDSLAKQINAAINSPFIKGVEANLVTRRLKNSVNTNPVPSANPNDSLFQSNYIGIQLRFRY